MTDFGLKHFRRDACNSYLVFDRATRQACVIDPRVDLMADYRLFIAEMGLKPQLAIDTHFHGDHFSATHVFQAEYGAEIAMSARSACPRVTRKLEHGAKISLGTLAIEVIETPGHSEDSLCLRAETLLFTGDTLLLGCTGSADLPSASVEELWKSLRERLAPLPDETIILPAHDWNELLFSTLGTEKKKNPHLRAASPEELARLKKSERPQRWGDDLRRRMEVNSLAAPTLDLNECIDSGPSDALRRGEATLDLGGVGSINVEKFSQKVAQSVSGRAPSQLFVDIRESADFARGHIPKSVNIPISEVALNLTRLSAMPRIYMICETGIRSLAVAKTLSYIGFPDVVNLTGGYRAWGNAGMKIEK